MHVLLQHWTVAISSMFWFTNEIKEYTVIIITIWLHIHVLQGYIAFQYGIQYKYDSQNP